MQNLSGWSISQTRSQPWTSRIRGETFALLGLTQRILVITDVSGQLSVHSSRVESKKNHLTLEEDADSCPETSVIYYQSMLCNVREEGSLKSHETGLISTHRHYLIYTSITVRRVSSHTYGSERDQIWHVYTSYKIGLGESLCPREWATESVFAA